MATPSGHDASNQENENPNRVAAHATGSARAADYPRTPAPKPKPDLGALLAEPYNALLLDDQLGTNANPQHTGAGDGAKPTCAYAAKYTGKNDTQKFARVAGPRVDQPASYDI